MTYLNHDETETKTDTDSVKSMSLFVGRSAIDLAVFIGWNIDSPGVEQLVPGCGCPTLIFIMRIEKNTDR